MHAADLAPLLVAGEEAQLDAPDVALSRDALHVRALSASQALALQRTLGRCFAPVAGGRRSITRFRTCAFRELAHSSISQRLNAVLALTLTRRLRTGGCRTSLLSLAGFARMLAEAAESSLRELNGTPTWGAGERRRFAELRALARDTAASLNARAWRRRCAPAAGSGGGL